MEDILVEIGELVDSSLVKKKSLAEQALSEEERTVFNILSTEPYHIDKISKDLGVRTPDALSVLLSLELKELIKQLPGKVFVRA